MPLLQKPLEKLPYGGEVLGRYFTCLIEGLEKKNAAAFASLFAPSFDKNKIPIPDEFFPQKVCNVYLRYLGVTDGGDPEWEVEFKILNNDGMAVKYFPTRDSGKTRFTLTQTDGVWTISKIVTVYSGSTYS